MQFTFFRNPNKYKMNYLVVIKQMHMFQVSIVLLLIILYLCKTLFSLSIVCLRFHLRVKWLIKQSYDRMFAFLISEQKPAKIWKYKYNLNCSMKVLFNSLYFSVIVLHNDLNVWGRDS
jgi:hypothetical protein